MQCNSVLIILLFSLSSIQLGTFAVPTGGVGIPSMKFDNNKLLRSSGTARDVSPMQRQRRRQQQHEQQQRKLSVSGVLGFSSWIPTLYNKVNKKNSNHHSCRKKHWWNTHCSGSSSYSKVTTTTTTTVETTYEGDVVETYEGDDGRSYIQSSQSAVIDSSSSSSSGTNNASSHKGANVFIFFLALFAGAAIGIALMAYGVSVDVTCVYIVYDIHYLIRSHSIFEYNKAHNEFFYHTTLFSASYKKEDYAKNRKDNTSDQYQKVLQDMQKISVVVTEQSLERYRVMSMTTMIITRLAHRR